MRTPAQQRCFISSQISNVAKHCSEMLANWQTKWKFARTIAVKFWAARIIAWMFPSKVRAAWIITRTFSWNETIGVTKFLRKAAKSQEFRQTLLALLLHNADEVSHACRHVYILSLMYMQACLSVVFFREDQMHGKNRRLCRKTWDNVYNWVWDGGKSYIPKNFICV